MVPLLFIQKQTPSVAKLVTAGEMDKRMILFFDVNRSGTFDTLTVR
jgi:hypothetical protein